MSILPTPPARQNRTIVLYLGTTLADYEHLLADGPGHPALIQRVELADSLNWGHLADGHAPTCPRQLHFTPHQIYPRILRHFTGPPADVLILRVRCCDCGTVFTILPSFIVRYKRFDTDAIEKFMSLLFITEDSYRMAGVSHACGMDTQHAGTWAALEATDGTTIRPRALWELVQWFGQLSPAQFNLALGLEPPTHILEDEKHLTQSGSKAYVPMIYAPKEALIWWVDYLASVSEADLTASLERFKALSVRLTQITGATVDGWDPAQAALRAAFPGITLQECHLHALRHLGTALATYKQQRKKARTPLTDQEEEHIRTAFLAVLQAPTPQAYQVALAALPPEFDTEPLAARKASLTAKQSLFQAWTIDRALAVVATALDQCMKFWDRKQENMQTFHSAGSGLATLNAWAITRNCWRFLRGAKRAGKAPIELAGADLRGIPWMQIVNLVLAVWPMFPLAAALLEAST
jgi:Domain of unknown function (DUF6431)